MIAARRRRVATRKNAGSPTSKVPPVRLLTSYDQTVATIVEEINRTGSGDRVEFCVYVLEPGESTERVLDAMRRAARRGVRVDASLDCSAVSSFTRWCEGTATLASELVEMEKRFPDTVTFTPRKIPTHAKYVMCHRANSVSTAVFGGVNIGDRFKPWRDFAIRAEGSAAVGALSLGVNGSLQTVDSKDTQGSTPKIDTRIGNPYFSTEEAEDRGQQTQKRRCRRGGETRRRRVLHQPTKRLVSTGVGVPEVRKVPRPVRRLPGVDRPDGRHAVGQVHRRGGVR